MSNDQAAQSDSYRWVMLSLYILVALSFWTCWFAQAPLIHDYWMKVFHVSLAKGELLLSLPGLVAIFLAVATGRWVDTVGVRKMMGFGAILGVIGFGLRPFFITSFAAQALLTVIAGYGVCILTATLAPNMIHWFGHEKAHTFIGIGAGSYFVGAGLGVLVTAATLGPAGVKGALIIWSVVIVVATILWLLFARDNKAAGGKERVAFGAEFKNVMQTGSSWLMVVFAIFISGCTVFVMGFLPGQMIRVHDLPPEMAGLVVGVYAIAMGVGLAFLPALASRWGRKAITIALCVITLIVWVIYMASPSWTVASLFAFAVVFGFFFEAPWATGLAIMESLPGVTARNVGVAAGVWTMAVNMGVFFLPILLGDVTDYLKMTGGMWSILISYFVAMAAVALVKEHALTHGTA